MEQYRQLNRDFENMWNPHKRVRSRRDASGETPDAAKRRLDVHRFFTGLEDAVAGRLQAIEEYECMRDERCMRDTYIPKRF